MSLSVGSVSLSELSTIREGIVRQPIRDAIADKLSLLIASGILEVGDQLPGERELAQALGVSREAVRGAIQTLSQRGILAVSQGARTRVVSADTGPVTVGLAMARAVDSYRIEHVNEARLLVERRLIQEACGRATARLMRKLHDLVDAQAMMLDDPVRFLICDREFHVTLYRASGNALLADFATDLYTYMMEHRRRAVRLTDAIARSVREHAAIVAALDARDGAAAVAAFALHTGRIRETTLQMMHGRDPPAAHPAQRPRQTGRRHNPS
ncbi:FadR/GntR family transcriptional regulator [Aureimonas frigidaquae]|uniref:Putative transcriptional regulator, GntR family protein n=1 Tax=Aureimonas frigidaquae TaxID=424757 RepID=A0A0P0Z4C2_9HYPH|nr:FCD domain-containing protein [Aureimonas frigidaquae]BAT28879.1 putative transcriptional regulator, GntR family protein [Aureimonas frigidaquae]